MKKTFILMPVLFLIVGLIIYLFFREEIIYYNEEYEILDTFSDTTNAGVYKFYFLNVTNLDSDFINYVSRKIIEPDINKFNKKGILIAHFYRLEDTLKLPKEMFEQLRFKYPNKSEVDKNLRYVIRGAVKTYFCDSLRFDDTLFYNKIIIPKYGIKAKDVLK